MECGEQEFKLLHFGSETKLLLRDFSPLKDNI